MSQDKNYSCLSDTGSASVADSLTHFSSLSYRLMTLSAEDKQARAKKRSETTHPRYHDNQEMRYKTTRPPIAPANQQLSHVQLGREE